MSPETRKFLHDLATWVEDGKCRPGFNRDTPICCISLLYSGHADDDNTSIRIRSELKDIFEEEYGCEHYPFGADDWDASNVAGDFYSPIPRNAARLEFLRRFL